MSLVAMLDLATFHASEGKAPEPVARTSSEYDDDDDDVWDVETADETPEDLEAIIAAARDELESQAR
ncbi:MAG TPA: hypothetical protein VL463_16615 [Kofleriaceae bacterium]|jgi:hypothetical protein|nr:hypothetical protein [Kofleriaceae bacterium]